MLDAVAKAEAVEADLDRFIDAQASKRQGEDADNLAAEAERQRNERKAAAERAANRAAWVAFYRRLAASNLAAARRYRSLVRRLENA